MEKSGKFGYNLNIYNYKGVGMPYEKQKGKIYTCNTTVAKYLEWERICNRKYKQQYTGEGFCRI